MSKEVREREYVVWPQYFDCDLSRKYGRKVSRELCVSKPSIKEIELACLELGFECRVNDSKLYPRSWFVTRGCVYIRCNTSKSSLLKLLAKKLQEIRQKRGAK
ncbi:MAG TPA: signal recognition particle protein Srp19 [Ignisphaera sp.]|uniref:Signal recognition particle 19 kDa protein n=1 Tax=Ignisphaera aggregans TaxID=334771 RepID=A0A833DT53_9CREN|nr:signal recognition particle protein Srp19 [Ignisphaera sp.]HIP56947.1 signal recognition particle protein Srp19 [Ignisphaera aggregans]